MPSVNIQFHMLPTEFFQFVRDVSSWHDLDVELERYYPKELRLVPHGGDLIEEVNQFGNVDCIWLLYQTPKSKKTEKFMLAVGRQRGRRLAQAQLGAGTDKAKAFQILKKVVAELKRRTTAGIWVVGGGGNVGYAKNFRISEGAKEASRAGKVDLVSIVFTQSFHVDLADAEKK